MRRWLDGCNEVILGSVEGNKREIGGEEELERACRLAFALRVLRALRTDIVRLEFLEDWVEADEISFAMSNFAFGETYVDGMYGQFVTVDLAGVAAVRWQPFQRELCKT